MNLFQRSRLAPVTPALTLAVLVSLPASAPTRALAAPAPATRYETPVLRVDVTGKGRPMVLIPGLTCSGDVWRETVAGTPTATSATR